MDGAVRRRFWASICSASLRMRLGRLPHKPENARSRSKKIGVWLEFSQTDGDSTDHTRCLADLACMKNPVPMQSQGGLASCPLEADRRDIRLYSSLNKSFLRCSYCRSFTRSECQCVPIEGSDNRTT